MVKVICMQGICARHSSQCSTSQIYVQAATGLGKLHGDGFLHGDISPYNIAVTLAEDGTTTATIIDLATLRRLDDSKVWT